MKLEARHIGFAYTPGVPVLHDISFSLDLGEVLFLLGRNGSGKTTLLSCLSGIQKPTSGDVILDGRSLQTYNTRERAKRIGHIPQLHNPAFSYSVFEMVLMGRAPHLSLFGSPSAADRAIAEEALENVGLQNLHDRPYTEISGGERQLTLIARGLAQKCDILLMDEPSAHLDLSNQHRVLEMVDQLAKQGLSFIISSHAPNNALSYAGRVILLNHGRVLAAGLPQETITESLLSEAYGMRTEVIMESKNGLDRARAVVAQRPFALPMNTLEFPDSPLIQAFQGDENQSHLFLVTGLPETGKTTWCGEIIQSAQARGLRVAGLLSPPVFTDGKKTGIDLFSIQSNERSQMATRRGDESGPLTTIQWNFDPQIVARGNAVLRDLPQNDLLIIDELGPLEFLRSEGFMEALPLLDAGRYRVAIVVIRPSLIPTAQARWPHARIITPLIDSNIPNRS